MNKILRIKKSDDKETSKKEIEKFAWQMKKIRGSGRTVLQNTG